MTTDRFEQLIHLLQSGCPAAQEEFVREWQPFVLRMVRRKLGRGLRRLAESADFTQAVWKSLFESPTELAQLASTEAIAGYLARMATHKVVSQLRMQEAEKRDLRRTVSLPHEEHWQPASDSPTPSQLLEASELKERLMNGLPADKRRIVSGRLEGYSIDELAKELGVNERTVRRTLDRLRVR